MRKSFFLLFLLLTVLIIMVSCKKELALPPEVEEFNQSFENVNTIFDIVSQINTLNNTTQNISEAEAQAENAQ
ncbi:MAG: hypothetical protein UR28_C0011G0013 [Candidatus Peregrinibacteria bacterium GW2011_GWF2_33_10]|nr:MAG: hypothetical protein UR28_C0011G0013 [Candidatus Peregrinibacteria bacterium GW2011_GWF2_33_10]OGJ44290.1 MAG: hypothetical protein A2272_05525 [Candidatus Peregrinibacteria bacterium RIFOXYA12_FULL_33_12]OGJ44665.1 MAG: hypothetical protein A2263_00965 [Candidatus Peregrinibacteria bacterium RIFOXYA2_FULL_33_21]OGJ50399.1 MAG: hypothetical protein A2307_06025 [Candidatus Peregrinibacteria bacterium RIFOXYB2_FULL_33_20]